MPSDDSLSAGMVVRASRRRRVVLEHENLKYELLSPNARGKLEVWQGRLEPGASSGSEPSTHPSEEFILVFSGEMRITIGGAEHCLEPGDSIQYDGNQPHTIVALGTEELRFISALTPPTL
ncbi:MAG: cupin domain-containing protein [Ilumatobacteraceae bacterium]|nr:cupin domain-containing protein [Ilumatobacteraceae bacterium]